MQLNVTTDYAIRIVLYLALKGGTVSSKELSEQMGIPQNYVLKITKKLNQADLIWVHIGTQGGFSIRQKASDISLFTIIQIMESTTKLNRCLEEDKYCSRFATESCPVRNFYCTLQNELEAKLSSITVQDLLKNN